MTGTGEIILGSLLVVATAVLGVSGAVSGEAVTGLLSATLGYVFGRKVTA